MKVRTKIRSALTGSALVVGLLIATPQPTSALFGVSVLLKVGCTSRQPLAKVGDGNSPRGVRHGYRNGQVVQR